MDPGGCTIVFNLNYSSSSGVSGISRNDSVRFKILDLNLSARIRIRMDYGRDGNYV